MGRKNRDESIVNQNVPPKIRRKVSTNFSGNLQHGSSWRDTTCVRVKWALILRKTLYAHCSVRPSRILRNIEGEGGEGREGSGSVLLPGLLNLDNSP